MLFGRLLTERTSPERCDATLSGLHDLADQYGLVRFGSQADISQCNRHVCFGSLADICSAIGNVRLLLKCAEDTPYALFGLLPFDLFVSD
jgi:hypothetical protein